MKLDRFHERVWRTAVGMLNTAYKRAPGTSRVEARGFWAGMLSTMLSFLPFIGRRRPGGVTERPAAPKSEREHTRKTRGGFSGYRRMMRAKGLFWRTGEPLETAVFIASPSHCVVIPSLNVDEKRAA